MADRDLTYQPGKRYSGGDLSHYFNNELGIAVNLIEVVKIHAKSVPGGESLVADLEEAAKSLLTIHQIGNAAFDQIIESEDESP